ncbi:MAG: ABC transporter ATP-binding protein [Solirubrobacterales bacterium]
MESGGGRPAAIRATALTKTYGEGILAVHALSGVDLDIAAGEFVVMLGPSGSGKTTLLNVVGGIEPPTAGEVEVAGRSLSGLGEDERTEFRRSTVGFIFQFFNLIPTLTALENVQLVAELSDRPDRSEEMLERVGLADRLAHFPAQLSGGEQQRVAVARALAGVRRCCSATSRPARSTSTPDGWSSTCCASSATSSSGRWSWSPTTPRSQEWPTASSASVTEDRR